MENQKIEDRVQALSEEIEKAFERFRNLNLTLGGIQEVAETVEKRGRRAARYLKKKSPSKSKKKNKRKGKSEIGKSYVMGKTIIYGGQKCKVLARENGQFVMEALKDLSVNGKTIKKGKKVRVNPGTVYGYFMRNK